MSIVFSTKVFAETILDKSIYYSDPSLNELVGSAERFSCQYQASNVSGTGPVLTVRLEFSNDNRGWKQFAVSLIKTANIVTFPVGLDSLSLPTAVVGRFVRASIQVTGLSPDAYLEVWITGRDAF